MIIRKYEDADVLQMNTIWNEVVMDGIAFPQEECLDPESGRAFFAAQSYCGVAQDEGERLSDFISCIPTISAGAGISAMPVMQCPLPAGVCISENCWWRTV